MDMSQTEAGLSDTDYSDFEYQHGQIAPKGEAGNYLETLEPLESINGLDNNEVAELVSYKFTASIEHEGPPGTTPDEFRGVIGINLGQAGGYDGGVGQNEDIDNIVTRNTSRDEVLDSFDVYSMDGSLPHHQLEAHYRRETGRGPVLDANDDLAFSGNIVDESGNAQGVLTFEFVWDTAEVSDAGRAFSVPTDD